MQKGENVVKIQVGGDVFKRVYVEITNVCNLSCSFCPGTGRPARFLAPAEFGSWRKGSAATRSICTSM